MATKTKEIKKTSIKKENKPELTDFQKWFK